MNKRRNFDVGTLLSARNTIQSAVVRSDSLSQRGIAKGLRYVSAQPDTWQFSVGAAAYAAHQGVAMKLGDVFSDAVCEESAILKKVVDFADHHPVLDRDLVLSGAREIAKHGEELFEFSTVVLTRLDVCKSLCGSDADCLLRCLMRTTGDEDEDVDG